MAVNKNESIGDKVVDFFTQKPEDHEYEKAGGDDRVPMHERTDDPKADANRFARAAGEEIPYPDHEEGDVPFADSEESVVTMDEDPTVERIVIDPRRDTLS